VNAVVIEIGLESLQFSFKIAVVPERHDIEKFPSNGSNQAFDEGTGQGDVGDGFQRLDIENPQICLPSMKLEQRIVVTADAAGPRRRRVNDLVEETTNRGAIRIAGVDGKADDRRVN
jgi:hypothetical protein